MKRYLILLPVVFVALASCKKTETPGGEYPVPEPGTPYILEGTVKTDGFGWKTNSSVGLYSAMDQIKLINKQCKIVGWANTDPIIDEETGENTNNYTPSEYEGKPVARFNTPNLDLVQGENKFMVYSPYNPELTFVGGVIYGLSIGDAQTQPAPNVAADCFSFGNASGIPGVDEVFKFELTPVTALAKVTITSSELDGYAPKKVTIYDDANTAIAGGFNIDINTMEITPVGDPLNRVSVEVQKPENLKAGETQNIYLNILPLDFTGKELWVVVELVDEAGAVLTIPTKQSDLKFEAGKTTVIDLSDLSTEMNAAGDWYAATETRLLPGQGVAYGDANTYFIQCKNGSTYTGATYVDNPAIPGEVTIDYRARGNFYNAVPPVGVTFEWATLSNGNLYTPRTQNYDASAVDPSQFEIVHNEAEKTVTVKNIGAYAGAPILLMKKDGKVLWAWSFWNVAADGTSIDPVTVGSYGFAPMDIGQPTTDIDKWIANNTPAGNPDPIFRMTHYYQWGRHIPVFWTTFWSLDGLDGSVGNVPAVVGPISLASSTSTIGLIVNDPSNQSMKNWCTEDYQDLWGELDPEKEGAKTIYDPCPKGWRVASLPALQAIADLKGTAQFSADQGKVYLTVSGLTFIAQGRQTAKLTTAGGRPSNMGMGEKADAAACKEGMLWSNIAGAQQGQGLWSTSNAHATKDELRIGSQDRSNAVAVRCIVDKDNR